MQENKELDRAPNDAARALGITVTGVFLLHLSPLGRMNAYFCLAGIISTIGALVSTAAALRGDKYYISIAIGELIIAFLQFCLAMLI